MPLITVVCPRCRDAYHLQEDLRGKPYRCRNCRHVFLVDDQPPPAEEQTSGSVGDIIPLLASEEEAPPVRGTHVGDVLELLPTEPAAPDVPLESVRPDEAVPAPDWGSPPPVRRSPKAQPDETPRPKPKPKSKREEPAPPRVIETEDWNSPPPVRRAEEPAPAEPKNDGTPPRPAPWDKPDQPPVAHPDHDLGVQPRTRWVKWVILPLVLVTVAGLGGGVYLIWITTRQTEETRALKAGELFDNGQFGSAAVDYGDLVKRYPDSEDYAFYRFRKELAELLQRVVDADGGDLGEALEHAGQFLKERQKDPLLERDAVALGNTLVKRLTDFAKSAKEELKSEEPLALEPRWRPVVAALNRVKLPKDAKQTDWAGLDRDWDGLRQAVARLKAKQAVVAMLYDKVRTKSGYAAVVAVEDYLREIRPSFPDVADSDEARKVLDTAFDNHLSGVRYQTAKTGEDGFPPPRRPIDEPSILFDPELKSPGVVRPGNNSDEVPALALVRGVLYAMDRATGRVRWARRVGIDTTALPLVVPSRVALKDLLLVLSSDTSTLTALNVRGDVEWRYALPAPVLGRPVLADRRAYLATYAGEVHEIELVEGKRLGKYNLGQRLTLGGTAEPGSSRVYFPADDGCVYVLNVAERRCEQIVYSRHPAGSLRGEPILIPPLGEKTPGYLVLNQAAGLDGVRLRVFELPIRDRRAAETPLKQPATLDGWTWFAPYHDAEKLILLSDAGRLGLFGIKQPLNNDQALFSLLPGGSYDLAARFGDAARRGRGEVVQVEGSDAWVLASGLMQRLRLAWGQQQGPRLIDVWSKPLAVGSPVHASQSLGSRLVSVTQPAGRSCAWVSAVHDEDGELLWRRQLGLVAGAEPVPIQVPGGEPIWLTIDQAGGLFALDPARYAVKPGTPWVSDDRPVLLAQGLPENLDQPPVVLPGPDGASAYVLAFPGDGEEMVVRQVTPAQGDRKLEVRESRVPLGDRPAGRPAIVGPQLLVPRADGLVTRFPLPLPATPVRQDGPPWRADRAGAEARCVIVPMGGSRFVTTDGARGLMAWDWPGAAAAYTSLPPGRGDEPTLSLKERVVHAAAVAGTPWLVARDSAGHLTLVEQAGNGALAVKREWPLGEVTAGPFVRFTAAGPRVGCVVGRTRLVWLNPGADGEAWRHETKDGAAIVGEPLLCDGLLVVADQSGRYVGLDPVSGKPVGDGYPLTGSVAPVASPVPFQKGRLLAPLSDGTVLLLGAGRLRGEPRTK